MNRLFIISFVACLFVSPSLSFASFKVAEFTFLPNKSKKVLKIKSTVRESIKKDRRQKQIDKDLNLSDEEIEKLIGHIVLTK